MRILLYFFLWVFLGLKGNAQTFHAIIVSCTDDATIGKGCALNHSFLKNRIQKICENTSLQLNLIEITGKEVTSDKIASEIEVLDVDNQDVILFYYSGHGVNSGTDYPNFLIKGSKKIGINSIQTLLKNKKARLTLNIGDCCNYVSESMRGNKWISKAPPIKENCEKLFVNASGNIVASSSIKGQLSSYSVSLGGLYTSSFIDVLHEVLNSEDAKIVNWTYIFSQTNKMTQELASIYEKAQTPQYQGADAVKYSKETIFSSTKNKFAEYIVGEFENNSFWTIATNHLKKHSDLDKNSIEFRIAVKNLTLKIPIWNGGINVIHPNMKIKVKITD